MTKKIIIALFLIAALCAGMLTGFYRGVEYQKMQTVNVSLEVYSGQELLHTEVYPFTNQGILTLSPENERRNVSRYRITLDH